MAWVDVDRETAERLGLITKGQAPGTKHQAPPSLSPDDQELIDAAKRIGWTGLFDDLK